MFGSAPKNGAMAKYATDRLYGGRRATVTDPVVVAVPSHDGSGRVCLRAATIDAVSASEDAPYIRDPHTWEMRLDATHREVLRNFAGELVFVETRTQADVEEVPLGSWTWPLRSP